MGRQLASDFMKFPRLFTAINHDPYHGVTFEKRRAEIKEEDGAIVYACDVTVPAHWSQVATDLLASKYLWRGNRDRTAENDARQAFDRLAFAWKTAGEKAGIFSGEDAQSFFDEIRYQLVHQMGSPNSPQWFNTGLFQSYGVAGPPQGHYFALADGTVRKAQNSFEHPQAHACFIQSVRDNLVNPGGIMDLWLRESRLFKFGSGTGTNFSSLRGEGEPLAGGGVSSGLLSFLRIGDTAAGAVRSGGTTRRAAKMVVLDCDHPDVEAFVEWKAREERKVSALISGSFLHRKYLTEVWNAQGPEREKALAAARAAFIPESYLQATIECAERGENPPEFPLLDNDWRNEAYQSVSGQNSNNSVRVSESFLSAVESGKSWALKRRSDGATAREIPARDLWKAIARSAWECADPGLQFETTISQWHTCQQDGPIRGSNPCAEYLFLDDTGCNLASLNLLAFLDKATGEFATETFRHSVRLWTVVLEITVAMAGYPSETIAERSFAYRTLGLGYANLGALLMAMGVGYADAKAAAITSGITALMTAQAFETSSELAQVCGTFSRYSANKESVLRVLRNHRRAAFAQTDFEGLRVPPKALDASLCPKTLVKAAQDAWNRAYAAAEKHGLRNAQVTAIAPTGTIGLVMDCDTMGIEPEFALLKFKKLAGGGVLQTTNRAVGHALRRLGYAPAAVQAIEAYIDAEATIEGAPGLTPEHLPVFDCANRCGAKGTRVLAAKAHLEVVAAAQAFVSGGVSKTINLPHEVSVADIQSVYDQAWKLGLKAVSVYRTGSKLSQPLGSVRGKDDPSCVECG